MLLRFRVSNHRSLRDEQELSLVAAPRRGDPAATGPVPPTVRVAGIYGANASGKSNVLHAVEFFVGAVQDSYAKWPVEGGIPREPFLLSLSANAHPSRYEIDLAVEGVRYTYGFEVDDDHVRQEWLYSYHASSRRRRLFHRERDVYQFGRSLTGANAAISRLTRKNALYLSVAAANDHALPRLLYSQITARIGPVLRFGQGDPMVPMYARANIAYKKLRAQVEEWLRLADLGITGFELEKSELTVEQSVLWDEAVRSFRAAEPYDSTFVDLAREAFFGKLKLLHSRGQDNAPAALPFEAESSGTQIWLAILTRVIGSISLGSALLVDEVDSSMHPKLTAALIQMFKDPEINQNGGQLIFTSHDVSLLGNLVEDEVLSRDEVWFTEKNSEGATTLYPLSDFHPRKGENFERAYIQGRYGAVPYVEISDLRRLLSRKDAS